MYPNVLNLCACILYETVEFNFSIDIFYACLNNDEIQFPMHTHKITQSWYDHTVFPLN